MLTITLEDWQDIVKEGYTNDMIAFDTDANFGVMTFRLIVLMKSVMRLNLGATLQEIYVSESGKLDLMEYLASFQTETIARGDFEALYEKIYDLEYLGDGAELDQYFLNDLGGTLPYDSQIVIGVGWTEEHERKILLGSF
jgi:hypothetical protein